MSQIGYGFGRRISLDARDATFPLSRALTRQQRRAAVRTRGRTFFKTGPVLDQGTAPSAVAHAWRQALVSAPLLSQTTASAEAIHAEIRHAGVRGVPVRDGAKFAVRHFLISGYLWIASALDARDWLLAGGGVVVMGSAWKASMMQPDGHGCVSIDGDTIDQHAYVLVGFDQDRDAFRTINSWGAAWGQSGRCWIRRADLQVLIDQGGEGCCPVAERPR